jgi:polar amino acid transport system substrate-binding protein
MASSTLQKIISSGNITIAVVLGLPPFGMTTSSGQPEGFDVDVGKAIAAALNVKVTFLDTTEANRIPNLVTGKVDLVIGDFTSTDQRAMSISFTNPYLAANYDILSKKGSGLTDVTSLTGKTVAVPKGSTQAAALQKVNPKANILNFDTTDQCIQAVLSGQADAMVEDTNIDIYAAKVYPTQVTAAGLLPLEYRALGLRIGDPVWQNWLNLFLFNYITSGEWLQTYEKWFGQAPPYLLTGIW